MIAHDQPPIATPKHVPLLTILVLLLIVNYTPIIFLLCWFFYDKHKNQGAKIIKVDLLPRYTWLVLLLSP
jgi:hypothetical protein